MFYHMGVLISNKIVDRALAAGSTKHQYLPVLLCFAGVNLSVFHVPLGAVGGRAGLLLVIVSGWFIRQISKHPGASSALRAISASGCAQLSNGAGNGSGESPVPRAELTPAGTAPKNSPGTSPCPADPSERCAVWKESMSWGGIPVLK